MTEDKRAYIQIPVPLLLNVISAMSGAFGILEGLGKRDLGIFLGDSLEILMDEANKKLSGGEGEDT